MTEDEFHEAVEELGYRASTFQNTSDVAFIIEKQNGHEWEDFARGHLTWDGCSNWVMADESGFYVHFCSREQLLDLGYLLAACYDRAMYIMDNINQEPRKCGN